MHAPRFTQLLPLAVTFLMVLSGSPTIAAPFTLTHTLTNPTPGSMDRFGTSVDISGDTIFVGAVFDNNGGFTDTGRTYVYDAPSGLIQRAINNPRRSSGDHFGVSLDVDGTNGVVGAHFEDLDGSNAGLAYLFDVSTGALLHTLRSPEASGDDRFGGASSISGDHILIGARNGDASGAGNGGGAYIYDAATGTHQTTLINPNASGGDLFGFNLDLNGGIAAVGAAGEDTGASNAGAVYLFDASSGALTQSLFNPNPSADAGFGNSINVFDGRVLVGAAGDDTTGVNSGSAYLFDATTGSILHSFNNPTASATDVFGSHVVMNDDFIVISASGDDTAGTDAGAAYVYDATTFSLLQTIVNPNPGDTFFGGGGGDFKMALGEDWLAISNANGSDSGTVFVYAQGAVVPGGGALPVLLLGLTGLARLRRKAAV